MNNPHKDSEILLKETNDAKKYVEIGELYYHYKHPEQLYKVLGFGFLESNNEICVIYQGQYGDGITFIRSLTSWLDIVESDGEKVNRFSKQK